jgi:cytochrome c biogenesis protein CcdA
MTQCGQITQLGTIDIGVITSAALADSINPCAIAVLLILLATLIAAQDKKRALKAGFAFIGGLFISYFAFGLGLFGALNLFAYAKVFHIIVGIFAILVGLYYIKLYFWPPKGKANVCIGGVCAENSPTVRIISRVTSPLAAFLAGIAVSFFELPCTGGPYFFTLGLLSQKCGWSDIFGWLFYYNIIFVLPLAIIVWIFYIGKLSIDKANKLKNKYQAIIELLAGILMVGLGIWVLLN